ncbi:DODA-type extradiol aromatic ring-opening family dioxygenase [Psychrobacter aestuarii]|uniref:Class III extradiol ring-cleavage dioxygenase n=1 Tax=Psychrobacter aestuarii TaxID=556327 RepID=A0ABP3F876_9GAMM|nr:class III extradiol ring-cleavage dioxygenase [Psychrobacter aestuarii]
MNTASDKAPMPQPVFFIPHGGGPCFFMDWQPADTWRGMAEFLSSIGTRLPVAPSAIVVTSAHWQASSFSVTASAQPALIYDYYGFPKHTYELTYPANGAPHLATRISETLTQAGLSSTPHPSRGFDHGVFIPLKLMFPNADIPVVQLSLRHDLDPEAHLLAGRALADLRKEGVLIIASGMSFHNMKGYGDANFTAPSKRFDTWLTDTLARAADDRWSALIDWKDAPSAHISHPIGAEEHLLPLMVAVGAAGEYGAQKIYTEQVLKTQLSAWQFGG